MSERTPEERERAAAERAARRRQRMENQRDADRSAADPAARSERAGSPAALPEGEPAWARRVGAADPAELEPLTRPVPEPEPELGFDPLPPSDRWKTIAMREPRSYAARAQGVGGPGRPKLPARTPKSGRWFRRGLSLLALALIGAALWVINSTFQPFHSDAAEARAVAVRIPSGENARGIGDLLQRKGVIKDARFFELNATLTLRRGKLQTGNYILRRGMANGKALDALQQGPKVKVIDTFPVVIPEGPSIREAAKLVSEAGVEGRYARAARSRKALDRVRKLGAPKGTRTAEGFLFPATYELKAGAGAATLVDMQLDAFAENFSSVNLKRAKKRNLTAYEVLIIASLIERESPSAQERPIISSVIYNRLKIGEPLGIDATIRYAEDNWTAPLKQSELDRPGPYNTRRHAGLPPTPIGNPGLASIEAAAKPAKTDYLFYVAKPGGCHAFSKTAAEHERNVAEYEAARERAGGKAPEQDCSK